VEMKKVVELESVLKVQKAQVGAMEKTPRGPETVV